MDITSPNGVPDLPSSALLMAAGLGTRLQPFTNVHPKALVPLMGVPISQFALDSLSVMGIKRVVANVHHLHRAARSGLEGLDHGGMDLRISDESDELLGSAGGIRNALGLLGDGPFFLLNADVLCNLDLERLWRSHQVLRARWGVNLTLGIFRNAPLPGLYREVIVSRESGLVLGLGELKLSSPFFVGAAVLEVEALRNVPGSGPADFVSSILRPEIERGKAGAWVTQGFWHDLGSPELWWQAHLAAITGLETGRLPLPWRRRIETRARRVGMGLWIGKEAQAPFLENWVSPAFWDGRGKSPISVGPGAVIYGELPFAALPTDDGSYRGFSGIAFQGHWVSIPDGRRGDRSSWAGLMGPS